MAPAGVDSYGIGWAPDGRAVVGIDAGPCGADTSEPGTFLVDPNGKVRTRIHPFFDSTSPDRTRLERAADRLVSRLYCSRRPA